MSPPKFDWKTAVSNFTLTQGGALAAERGFGPILFERLRDRGLIGSIWIEKFQANCIAFPVQGPNGTVFRAHARAPKRNGDGKWDWTYEPIKDPLGRPVPALLIGNPATAVRVFLFESQWDGFALIDQLDLFEQSDLGETVVVATRGATNPAKIKPINWAPGANFYALPQNDSAGRDWLSEIIAITGGCYVVETPAPLNDLNDWVRDPDFDVTSLEWAIDHVPLQKPLQASSATGAAQAPPPPKLTGRSIFDLLDLQIDPVTNLLGDRYLTQEGSMFIIAPSGHGKSSFAIQAAICWAIGRVAFGIKPVRPLRILIVQSEDDDAESKKFAQVIRKLKLTPKERDLLRANTRFEFRRNLHGESFIAALDSFLTDWPADIAITNPLTGFYLSDLKNEEKVAGFLRGRLSVIMEKHHCAPLVVHHMPKVNFMKLENMQWYDWMYAMSGCAALTNWSRAVLVIAPSKHPGTYRFIAAKRFRRDPLDRTRILVLPFKRKIQR
jgi:hypothetical protein